MRRIKSEVFIRNPYLIFYIIAATFLVVAVMNGHSAALTKDYRETEGYICNLEEGQELWHGEYVIRYSYDIVWYDDGQEYTEHLDSQVDYVEEGPRTIWVHPENVDAALDSSEGIDEHVPAYFLIAVIAAIIGYILYKQKYDEKRMSRSQLSDYLLNVRICSMMAVIFSVIGVIIIAGMNHAEKKNGQYLNPVMNDLYIFCGIIVVIGLFQFFKAGRKIKKKGL